MKAALCAVLLVLSCGQIQADEALRPVQDVMFCAQSNSFCAHSSLTTSTTAVGASNSVEPTWSFHAFVQNGFISDDGDWVVSCYGGRNLVPVDAGLDFVIAIIYGRNGERRSVYLRDLFTDLSSLPKTVSHKEWGSCVGISHNLFQIKKYDGSMFEISLMEVGK